MIDDKDARLAELEAELANKDAALAELEAKDAAKPPHRSSGAPWIELWIGLKLDCVEYDPSARTAKIWPKPHRQSRYFTGLDLWTEFTERYLDGSHERPVRAELAVARRMLYDVVILDRNQA